MRKLRLLILIGLVTVLASLDAGAVFAVQETDVFLDRQVEMERVFNFRDLGGYQTVEGKTVRRGIIFRSGELTYATDRDIRTMSRKLKIRCILDLRHPVDREFCPNRKVAGASMIQLPAKNPSRRSREKAIKRAARFRPLSKKVSAEVFLGKFAGSRKIVSRRYTMRLVNSKSSRKAYRKFFQVLLKNTDRKPILFHCITGKDRTGIAACMTLLALGVDEKVAVEEYALTNLAYKEVRAGSYGSHSKGVAPAHLRYALRMVKDEYRSYRNFLKQAYGLDSKDIAKLRELYLA